MVLGGNIPLRTTTSSLSPLERLENRRLFVEPIASRFARLPPASRNTPLSPMSPRVCRFRYLHMFHSAPSHASISVILAGTGNQSEASFGDPLSPNEADTLSRPSQRPRPPRRSTRTCSNEGERYRSLPGTLSCERVHARADYHVDIPLPVVTPVRSSPSNPRCWPSGRRTRPFGLDIRPASFGRAVRA